MQEMAFMETEFITCVMKNAVNAELLRRLPSLDMNQCYLTAGCLFQALWNQVSGRDAAWGVKDYDIFYFDDRDISWEAEDAVIRRVQGICKDLEITLEVKNQARVHLWYEARFGATYAPLASSCEGIDRYLIACTCVGIKIATGDLYAPNGLTDLKTGRLRPNPLNRLNDRFLEKAQGYKSRWDWLTIDVD